MPYKDPQKQKEARRRYYLKKKCNIKKPEYPPIKIPKGMKETKYPGYFITENGKAFRTPGNYDRNEQYGKINEFGLIYLKPGFRGHPKYPEHHYECINISIRDENGKYQKQIKECIHRLVAETFIENPNNLPEIDHIDRNKKNNHLSNLRWIGEFENKSCWERDINYRKKLSENNRWTKKS
tara:strand:+ start:532 stop:1074 length:543 start_codon:yes stop_codon:yes gene_type:complete